MRRKLYISDLVLEVTRRCNMSCAHCCRGDAQNCDITHKVIDDAFANLSGIGSLVFTGGEPSLNVDAMPPRWVSGNDAPSFFFHRIDMLSGGYCLLVARAQGIVDKFPALSYVGDSFVLAAPKYSEVEANVAKAGKEMLSFFGEGFSHVDAAKICEMCKDFAFVYVPDKDAFVLPATVTSDSVHAYMDYLSKKMIDKGLSAAAETLSKYATATITE